jgi:hypothetical protein
MSQDYRQVILHAEEAEDHQENWESACEIPANPIALSSSLPAGEENRGEVAEEPVCGLPTSPSRFAGLSLSP